MGKSYIKCPYCGDDNNKVNDVLYGEPKKNPMPCPSIRRRRECLKCGKQFKTREITESDYKKYYGG